MRQISIVLIACFLYSCSKTVYVSNDNYEAVRMMINQEALQKTCRISYDGEKDAAVNALNVRNDSVRFVTNNFKFVSLPVSEVQKISFSDRAGGAADGALAFFVAGSLYGALRLAGETDGDVPFIGYCLFAAIYGLPFAAVGIVGGAITGRNNVFDFTGMRPNIQTVSE